MWAYRKALRDYLSKNQYDLLYARSPLVVSALTGSGQPVCLELHTLPNTHRKRFVELANQCKAVVCLTTVMRDELKQWGVSEALLQVAPDGVALHRFKNPVASTIKLNTERPIVGYIGSLVTQNVLTKGVGEMVSALAELKKAGTQVHGLIVGGPKKWQQKYQDQAKQLGLTDEDVTFVEQVPAAQVPAVLKQCDTLVYPAPKSNHPYYLRDTSPLKIFEYLAAGKTIVAANLPPIHDVLDEAVAYFCEPGDAKSLAAATERALKSDSDPQISLKLAAEHEWSKRMQKILDSVSL